MNNIESVFVEYSDLVNEFGKEKLISRYETILEISQDFILKMSCYDRVYVNEMILLYAMCDYFSDILRLKSFHKINKTNEIKILSYEIYWLLKRKPLQVKCSDKDLIYINEEFALSLILHYLSDGDKQNILVFDNRNLEFFINSLFYYLKYRPFDAQVIEMLLVSFNAGKIFKEEQSKV